MSRGLEALGLGFSCVAATTTTITSWPGDTPTQAPPTEVGCASRALELCRLAIRATNANSPTFLNELKIRVADCFLTEPGQSQSRAAAWGGVLSAADVQRRRKDQATQVKASSRRAVAQPPANPSLSAPSGSGGNAAASGSGSVSSVADFMRLPEAERKERIKVWYESAPIDDGRILEIMFRCDIKQPFGYVNFRPDVEMSTGAVLLIKAGAVGNTYLANPDMLIGEDPTVQNMQGSFTAYEKAVVTRPDMVVRAWDAFITDYHGGMGVEPADPILNMGQDVGRVDFYARLQQENASVYCTLRDINFNWHKNALDITGAFPDSLAPTETEKDGCSYWSSQAVTQLWAWKHNPYSLIDMRWNNERNKWGGNHDASYSTLCFQTMQWLYAAGSSGGQSGTGVTSSLPIGVGSEYSLSVQDRTHLGPNIGDGMLDAIRGTRTSWPDYNYTRESGVRIAGMVR